MSKLKIYFNGKLLKTKKRPRAKLGQYERYDRVFMKRFVIGFFVILPWTFAVAQYQILAMPVTYEKAPQEAQNELVTNETTKAEGKEVYQQYAREKAIENGVSVRWVNELITCETAGTWDKDIQSYVIQDYGREKSYGLAQIHIPDNPSITYEDATDPYYSIDFIINETLQDRHEWRWKLCYKKYRNKYPI